MVNNLRARREKLGLSLRTMAKMLKVQPSTLSRWETRDPGPHQYYRASALLDFYEFMLTDDEGRHAFWKGFWGFK